MLEKLKTIDLVDPLLRPDDYFKSEDRDLFVSALKTLGLILLVGTVLIFLTTLVNMKELEMFNLAIQNQTPIVQAGWQKSFQNALPWNRLTFPIFWFVVIFTTGGLRHLFLTVLGESRRSLGVTQAITIFGVLPLLLFLVVTSTIGNLSPNIPQPGETFALGAEFWLSMVLLPVAFVWDGYICLKGFRASYGQNTGRAILTWLAPALGYGILFVTLFILTIFWSVFTGVSTTT